MTVSIFPDKTVKVDAVLTHYGHEKELQHLRICKRKRQEIAAKLKQGVSRENILDEVRESVTENLGRHHLLARKDLANIERAYGLQTVQRHANDHQSVLAWITERKQSEDDPILYYKLQGQEAEEDVGLSKEDFFIVIQSPLQKHMYQKFAHKGICCDSTHGTNAYDFSLTIILVIDEFGQGFPSAWCLSSHEDFTTMTIFFKEIKKTCGVVNANFFMSDMAPQFYNAWVAVMGDPRPIKLICTWHVDKAWKEELRKKIGDISIEAEVYKMLRIVLQQPEENTFKDCLQALCNRLKSTAKCEQFNEYFNKEWAPKKEQWAYCYRKGLQINTNMYVEAFHRVFKRIYLKGKINKRVDNCLVNLLKYARDTGFDRLIKMTKGKLTYRINIIHERHNQSMSMPTDSVEKIGDGKWKVLSENGKTFYEVMEAPAACQEKDACQMSCPKCRVCVHAFACTCPDSLIMSTICKHIHLVKRTIMNESVDQPNDAPEHTPTDSGQPSLDEIENILTCIRSKTDDVDTSKRRIKGILLRIMEEMSSCDNSPALKQLEKQVSAAYNTFLSLKDEVEMDIIPHKNNEDAPANKNMDKQPRFYSTKKRCQKSKVRLACPTFEEQEAFLKEVIDGKMEKDDSVKINRGMC